MKRIYMLLLAGVAALFASCNFLDVELQGATTEETYYQNVDQLQEALTGV